MGDMDIRDNWTELSDVLRTVDVTKECNASEGTIGGWFTTHEWQITDDILHYGQQGWIAIRAIPEDRS